ncbi:MAG: hypothetical protein ACT6RD_05395 [Brevundimonas sp.]|uniref:hypothetical protein n=1 Tax=Brevundimonas sp. TaxID=1871086 RepID=UPI00403453AA
MTQTAMQAGQNGARGGLPLGAALVEAVRAMPQMMRGAGPALILTTVLLSASGWLAGWAGGVVGLAAAVGALAAFGAVTRIGLFGLEGARERGLGRGGFQLRRLEFRLLGATLLIVLFMSIILSLLGLTALALFGASGLDAGAIEARDWAQVGPLWKLVLLGGVALVVVATPVVFLVRLSLYAQATAVWGRMASLATTGLTNGAMIPLLAGLAASAAPALLWMVVTFAAGWSGVAAGAVGAALLMLVQTPLTAGFLGAAWRRLGREEG